MNSGSRNGVGHSILSYHTYICVHVLYVIWQIYIIYDASMLPSKAFEFFLSSPEESVMIKMESGAMSGLSFMGSAVGSKSLRYVTMDIENRLSLNRDTKPCLDKPLKEQENYHRQIFIQVHVLEI